MTSPTLVHEPKDITLSTGLRLRCLDLGPRNGESVLFLHGFSDSSFSFSRILELLPPDLRLIIPDQRGHGDSDRPENGYTPDDFAADAIALLDRLGVESCTVVGHSLGSFIARRMAAVAPERIGRLVLVGSGGSPRNDAVLGLAPSIQALTDPVDIDFVREFQMSTIYRPVPPAFLDRVIAESLKLPARVWRAVLSGLVETPVDPAAIACPVSILWGDRDAIFSRSDQDDLLRRIPGARLHVFTDIGHDPQWEAPEEFVRWLLTDGPDL